MQEQYILTEKGIFFVVKDCEPITHNAIKSYPDYEALLAATCEALACDYDEVLGMELIIVRKADHHFDFVIHGQSFEKIGYDLVEFIINFEM
jgi:hypothetical protein|tara:strand:+ start:197 stop:472 length:276 start_codon:yes stop_codon:yes gene_type:complete